MKKITTTLVLFLFIQFLFAQGETDYWHFGHHAGLHFDNGTPVALTDSELGSFFGSIEGSASISDTDGNLLFYTDGITVWNATHQIMANGAYLWGGYLNTTTQAAIIIPLPLSNKIYYIFTVDSQAGAFGGYGGISYSIVDISLEGGLGAVTTKNVPLLTPTTEKLTAVHHSNGRDIWIMTQQWGTDAKYAWLLSDTGLAPTPIVSHIGYIHYSVGNENAHAAGYLKFSPDGTKLASAFTHSGIAEVFDFNNTTGIVSNPIIINTQESSIYGLAFSPDGSRLYGTTFATSKIFQWDLSLESEMAINSSKTLIYQTPLWAFIQKITGVQLGIDCRIYVAVAYLDSMDIIQNPNELGLACNYVHNALSLQGNYNSLGVPNFIQSYFNGCNTTIGTNTVPSGLELSVYPNPFTSEISIELENPDSKLISLSVSDLLGREIFHKNENNAGNNYSKITDLHFLPKGIYLLEIVIDGEKIVKKIVKE